MRKYQEPLSFQVKDWSIRTKNSRNATKFILSVLAATVLFLVALSI